MMKLYLNQQLLSLRGIHNYELVIVVFKHIVHKIHADSKCFG